MKPLRLDIVECSIERLILKMQFLRLTENANDGAAARTDKESLQHDEEAAAPG